MSNSENKRPTHAVYVIIGNGEKARWHRVGAAWENKDHKGFNVVFDSIPLTGRVVIREVTEDNGGQS